MPVNDIPSSSQTREDFVTRVEKKCISELQEVLLGYVLHSAQLSS